MGEAAGSGPSLADALLGDSPVAAVTALLDWAAQCASIAPAAAYVTMPFATCWCVFRLPLDLRRQVETVFRTAMTARYAHLTDEVMWTRGLDAAAAAWAVHATVALLSRALQDDLPMHASRRPVPSARQLLRYRWEGLAAQASFPALAELGRRLLATTAWQVPDLPTYPAWN